MTDDALMQRCREVLGNAPSVGAFVPGRVELLGKHTDYAGGRSIVLAVDRGFRMAAARRPDTLIRMIPADDPASAEQFEFGAIPDLPAGHWARYPATVAERVWRNFSAELSLTGADIAFESDLPPAAGMSSSSAFMIATFLCLSAVNDLDRTDLYARNIASPTDLAMYLACVENGQTFGELTGSAGVGTFGGSEDHTAILCGRAGKLGVFSYAPTVFEQWVDWPDAMALVVATCGVAAEKTGAHKGLYNRASLRARRAVEVCNDALGGDWRNLRQIVSDLGPAGLGKAIAALEQAERTEPSLAGLRLPARLEQFYREDQVIIPAAIEALRQSDYENFGRLCDESHARAAEGLENNIPQTNALQRLARSCGAVAASTFGAGFGGGVWAMVEAPAADAFADAWLKAYRCEFPSDGTRAVSLVTRPSAPAGPTRGRLGKAEQ